MNSTYCYRASQMLTSGRQPDFIQTKNKLSSLRMFQRILRKIDQWKYEMYRLSSPPANKRQVIIGAIEYYR